MDLDLLLRTSAVLIAAGLLSVVLSRAAAATRHFVWHLAILVVLAVPFLSPVAPKVPIVPSLPDVPWAGFSSAVTKVPVARTIETQQNNALGTDGPLGTDGTLGTAGTDGATGALSSLALVGSIVVFSWFAFCWLLSGVTARRGSEPAPAEWNSEARAIARRLGLADNVQVRRSYRDGSPFVAGLFRSVVILPPSAADWSVASRQAALVHELMHIRRSDRRTQALAQLACAIYWFNPLVWYAAAALARERERACDAEVVRLGATPSEYATLLLDLARVQTRWLPATALSMARRSAIEGRLLLILDRASHTPRAFTRWIVAGSLAAISAAIMCAEPASTAVLEPAQTVAAGTPQAPPSPKAKSPDLMKDSVDDAPPAILGSLIDALGDSDGQVREQAALGLALTPGRDVVEPLLKALTDDDPQVREKAAIGLSFRRDPRIIEPLLVAIEDPDAQVREKAAIALGASGDDRAIGALRKAMKDSDSQVREKAVAGLVLLGLRR